VRILVTGATGFIGRRLVTRLLREFPATDITILALAAAKPEEAAALERFRGAGVRVIMGDLNRPDVSDEPAPAADWVLHLAANIDTAAKAPELRVNAEGTGYLLDWLKPVSRGARIVYTSSVAVHDRNGVADGPLTETSPFTPRTLYGSTKLKGEEILRTRAAADGYTYTIVRLSTVYGPGSKPGGMFDLFFEMTEKGSLGGRLDWPGRTSVIHVDDTAELIVALAKLPAAANEIYAVGNPYAPTVSELLQQVGRASGHPVRVMKLPSWMWSTIRHGVWSGAARAIVPASAEQFYWRVTLIVDHGFWFDTAKLQRAWPGPYRDLDEGIREMLASRRPLK
jgi:nucleoside-diphosphate-sugar epimerase